MRKSVKSKSNLILGLALSLVLCSCKGEMGSSIASKTGKIPTPGSTSDVSSPSTGSSSPVYRTIPAVVIVGKKETVVLAKTEVPVESYQALAE